MSGMSQALHAHLATGNTTTCRCWLVRRRDGRVLGFTDHDRDLEIDGVTYRADSGFTGRALQQGTGLSVDNSSAVGTLSSPGISAEDLEAGRFDGAEVTILRVNWADPSMRKVEFRGSLGEITRSGSEFEVELRGLSEPLNRPNGMVYQRQCTARLGDTRCGVDLMRPEFRWQTKVVEAGPGSELLLPPGAAYPAQWFSGGRVEVLSGSAQGLAGTVKQDRAVEGGRRLTLWEAFRIPLSPDDTVAVIVGCDRTQATCQTRFGNFLNFRGFPHVPGEDWVMSFPTRERRRDGGSRYP